MTKLPQLLFGRDVHAPVHQILEALPLDRVGERAGLPHSIYQELWHIDYWQRFLVTRARGETPDRVRGQPSWPAELFPRDSDEWRELLERLRLGLDEAAAMAADAQVMDRKVGEADTVRGLLESLAVHNSYHLARVVVLRQLLDIWPPVENA